MIALILSMFWHPSARNIGGNNGDLTLNILSVDDEPCLLYTREKILECEGYAVLSAADGEKALEFLETHDVDLVLLDYKMPGMDGGTVAREVKRRAPAVPIIMISGNRVPGEALANVDCFIPKGQGPELLLAATRQFLVMPTHSHELGGRATQGQAFVRDNASRPIRPQKRRSSDTAELRTHRFACENGHVFYVPHPAVGDA